MGTHHDVLYSSLPDREEQNFVLTVEQAEVPQCIEISFFGDLTNTIAFTILNQPPFPSRFQY